MANGTTQNYCIKIWFVLSFCCFQIVCYPNKCMYICISIGKYIRMYESLLRVNIYSFYIIFYVVYYC